MSFKEFVKEADRRPPLGPNFREDVIEQIAAIISQISPQDLDLESGLDDRVATEIYDKVLSTIFKNLNIRGI